MFSTQDTIVAIATPPGRGGLGVIRISGPECQKVSGLILEQAHELQPRHATLTRVRGVDSVIATFFVAPQSYTGEDVVEISAHGSPVVLQEIVQAAQVAGARLAEPGEFTLRAFLHGRIDLVQAEAVGDIINAVTPLQARTAFDQLEGTLTRRIREIDAALFDLVARLESSLDFPDEDYHFIEPSELSEKIRGLKVSIDELRNDAACGRMVREGAQVTIVGRPNTGKSSLFNALAGTDRAIVTDRPGTTRDLVTEVTEIEGLAVTLVDTAGVRNSTDVIEREGVSRAHGAVTVADLLLVTLDQSSPLTREDYEVLAMTQGRPRKILLTKCDCGAAWLKSTIVVNEETLSVSALTGAGLDELRKEIAQALTNHTKFRDIPAISNLRHIALLEKASSGLMQAERAATNSAAEEFVISDLQQAQAALEEITGARSSEDLLQHIFERFCIGK